MQINDPNEPQVPETPQEPAPAPEQEPAPQIDLETAYNLVAEAEGWDPRLTRYEMNELKRRREEVERKERELERQRRDYAPPQPQVPDYLDPGQRILFDMIQQDREERRREREERQRERDDEIRKREMTDELYRNYVSVMRQNGATADQIQENQQSFFDEMANLYPDGVPERLGVERAVQNTYRFFGGTTRRVARSGPQVNGRGPTATRIIPGSPQPYAGAGNPLPPEESLSAEQLPGETDEQYEARLRRIIEGAGVRRLPDGARVRSG